MRESEAPPARHPARLFDARHLQGVEATVQAHAYGLLIDAGGGERVWKYEALRRRGGEWSRGVVNLEHDEGREMLEVTGTGFASELRRHAPRIGAARAASRGTRLVVGAVVALVAAGLALVLALPWIAGLLALRIPVEWEDRFGAAVVESSVPAPKRVEDAAVRDVVGAIVARLADASPSPYTFRVTVADDPGVNAFAAPGGHLVVHRGLLLFVRDPDELAAVLAHEMEHVTRRHVTRVLFQRMSLGLLAALAGGQSPEALGGGIEAVRALGDLSFGRAAEREADEGGLARLRAAGFPEAAMAAMLDRLADSTKDAEPPELLSTHPDPRARAARVRGLASGRAPGAPAVTPGAWAAMRAALGHAGAPAATQ